MYAPSRLDRSGLQSPAAPPREAKTRETDAEERERGRFGYGGNPTYRCASGAPHDIHSQNFPLGLSKLATQKTCRCYAPYSFQRLDWRNAIGKEKAVISSDSHPAHGLNPASPERRCWRGEYQSQATMGLLPEDGLAGGVIVCTRLTILTCR
jgi:hypothetical protein